MLKIGDFSKLSRISVRMLRHYDELGLLRPAEIDRFTGYRYYSEDQLPLAGRILTLRGLGFGLAEIGLLLPAWEDRETVDRFLLEKREQVEQELTALKTRLRMLDTLRKEPNPMKYNVTLKTLPQRQAATVRMTLPRYEMEGDLWTILLEETGPLGLVRDDPCYRSVVFHDREFKEDNVDLEAQMTVKGTYPDQAHVRFRTLPAVTFASATYQGPYSRIGEVNAAVAAWVRDNGCEYDGPAFNLYHVSPNETDDPEKYVTEVCYPVRKK